MTSLECVAGGVEVAVDELVVEELRAPPPRRRRLLLRLRQRVVTIFLSVYIYTLTI